MCKPAGWLLVLCVLSPWCATAPAGDGKIYCISEGGDVTILAAGDKFAKLADIAMGERICRASIAIADSRLFIRTEQDLYCIRKPLMVAEP